MSTESRIRKVSEKGPLNVSRVYSNEYQKSGTITAELKQVVTTTSYYPTKSIANSLEDNIFTMTDFNFKEEEYVNKETRVAWIDVPAGTTVEQVQAKLATMPKAGLYRTMSNHPVLSAEDNYAIDSPDLSVDKDSYANRQAVRYPDNNEKAGELALDGADKVQYRRIAFSTKGMEDQDKRTLDPSDYYASEEIKRELSTDVPQIESQTIGG